MKLEREKLAFKPIHVVLETKGEVEFMKALAVCNSNVTLIEAARASNVDFGLLGNFVQKLYNLLDEDC